MRKADIKSLIWLCRWYGGRSQRLDEIYQAHLSNLEQLVVEELGGTPQSETVLSLYGFWLSFPSVLSVSKSWISIQVLTSELGVGGGWKFSQNSGAAIGVGVSISSPKPGLECGSLIRDLLYASSEGG